MKYFHFQTEFTLASFRCLKSSIDRFQFFLLLWLDLLQKEKTNLLCFIPRVTIGTEHDPLAYKTFLSLVGPECHAAGCVTIPK